VDPAERSASTEVPMDRRRDGNIMRTGMRGRGMVRRGGEVLGVNSEMRGGRVTRFWGKIGYVDRMGRAERLP